MLTWTDAKLILGGPLMEWLNQTVVKVDDFLWGYLLVFLLVGVGIFLTIRMRGIQVLGFRHGVRLTRGKYDCDQHEGDLSHFQALATALSATVGVGNIAGVAIAIRHGGPGALFWMWVTAAVGMATKFTCCTLAVKYRIQNPDGTVSGGPMYYIERGLGPQWKWLAVAFAGFAVVASFGVGCMAQAGEMARAVLSLAKWEAPAGAFNLPGMTVGIIAAVMTGVVIIGGIKRIGSFTSKLVPFMSIFYILAALAIMAMNWDRLPGAVALVFSDAFTGTAATGGFMGSTFMIAMQWGVRRGLFSNESGLGSAPIAHATARTPYPVREGYVALLEPFIDTIIICSMTGMVIILSGAWTEAGEIGGADLTAHAFTIGLAPLHEFAERIQLGRLLVTVGIVLFAYSTAISWSYYGDRCVSYLFGLKAVTPYRYVFCVFLAIGATIKIDLVWNLSDIMNGLMALPNLVALVLLSGTVWRDLVAYRAMIPEFDREVESAGCKGN